MAAREYLREKHPEILRDAQSREHFHHDMFHCYNFDNTMLRHCVENPDIRYQDSLAQDHAGDEEKILADPRQSAFCRIADLDAFFASPRPSLPWRIEGRAARANIWHDYSNIGKGAHGTPYQ